MLRIEDSLDAYLCYVPMSMMELVEAERSTQGLHANLVLACQKCRLTAALHRELNREGAIIDYN